MYSSLYSQQPKDSYIRGICFSSWKHRFCQAWACLKGRQHYLVWDILFCPQETSCDNTTVCHCKTASYEPGLLCLNFIASCQKFEWLVLILNRRKYTHRFQTELVQFHKIKENTIIIFSCIKTCLIKMFYFNLLSYLVSTFAPKQFLPSTPW